MNFIKNRKFANYLLYAIGEIVLVVIGILIALRINNVNEGAKDLQKEQIYLQNIYNELGSDSARLENYIELNVLHKNQEIHS